MAVPNHLLALLLVGLPACRPEKDPVILSLGEQSVRRSDFDKHVRALETRGGSRLSPAVRDALLEPFLEERVLVFEARSRGLLKPEATAEEEQEGVQGLLATAVLSRVVLSDDETAAYYAAHAEELKAPETVTLRQILVPTEAEAREIQRKLLREPKSFGLLARSRSHSPEASGGGLMGTFPRAQLPPELEGPAFALAAGGTSDVIQTPLGYHILKVEARKPARDRSLDECRGEIRALLTRQRSDQSVRQFVRDLMARAKVNHEAAQARPRDS